MRVQFSRMEKGFEVSRIGVGILSKFSSIKSWGRSFKQVLGAMLFPEVLEGEGEQLVAGVLWVMIGAIDIEAKSTEPDSRKGGSVRGTVGRELTTD